MICLPYFTSYFASDLQFLPQLKFDILLFASNSASLMHCAGGEIDSEDAVEGNQHHISNNFESVHAVPWNQSVEWEVLKGFFERVLFFKLLHKYYPP